MRLLATCESRPPALPFLSPVPPPWSRLGEGLKVWTLLAHRSPEEEWDRLILSSPISLHVCFLRFALLLALPLLPCFSRPPFPFCSPPPSSSSEPSPLLPPHCDPSSDNSPSTDTPFPSPKPTTSTSPTLSPTPSSLFPLFKTSPPPAPWESWSIWVNGPGSESLTRFSTSPLTSALSSSISHSYCCCVPPTTSLKLLLFAFSIECSSDVWLPLPQ